VGDYVYVCVSCIGAAIDLGWHGEGQVGIMSWVPTRSDMASRGSVWQ
jgi:hypothetical protein